MSLAASARAALDIYRAQFRTNMAVQVQYRASLLIWLIGAVLEPLIYLIVWTTVARAQGGSVQGLAPGDFAAYYIVGMIVNQLTFTWVMWEWDNYIREGALSAWLLRPWHPIHQDMTENVAYKTLTMVVMVPTVLVLALIFRPTLDWQWWSTLAFVPALVGAFLLRFFVEWSLALAAFWTTRTTAINELYYVIFLFFSGRLAPLALFPAAVGALTWLLPFRWMLSFPIELLLGNLTPQQAALGFAAQAGWIAVALLVLRLVWRAGVRRFGAVGG
jgi:ABC-2 type transport system permease protein